MIEQNLRVVLTTTATLKECPPTCVIRLASEQGGGSDSILVHAADKLFANYLNHAESGAKYTITISIERDE